MGIYRVRAALRHLFAWSLGVSVAVLCLVLTMGLPDVEPDCRLLFVPIFGGIPLFFFVLSLYGLLAAVRHKLTVTDTGVESRGITGSRSIGLDEIVEARWQLYGAGRLKLIGHGQKLAIDFSDYRREEARELIRFFRLRLPESVQQGWERFWEFSWRRFVEPGPTDPEACRVERLRSRRRVDLLSLVSFLVWVPASVWILHQADPRWPVVALVGLVALVFLVFWACLRTLISRTADVPQPGRKDELVPPAFFVWFIACFVVVPPIALVLMAMDVAASRTVFLSALLLGEGGLVVRAALTSRQRKSHRAEEARRAEESLLHPQECNTRLPGQEERG